jgi:hypothetical protein
MSFTFPGIFSSREMCPITMATMFVTLLDVCDHEVRPSHTGSVWRTVHECERCWRAGMLRHSNDGALTTCSLVLFDRLLPEVMVLRDY